MTEETKAAAPQVQPPAAEKPVAEKQTNCLGCGKPLKKLKIYYRNGKYYCAKKCWRKTLKPKEGQPAA